LDFTEVDIVEAVKASTSGFGAHAVICTANGEKAYEQSMQMLRRLGTLVCVGIPNVPFKLPVTPLDMIVKGMSHNRLRLLSCTLIHALISPFQPRSHHCWKFRW
jgi:D-arabinose 1-dehydrogenase-like Zn-dependent alcohol dehydrogenase